MFNLYHPTTTTLLIYTSVLGALKYDKCFNMETAFQFKLDFCEDAGLVAFASWIRHVGTIR